MNKKYIMAIDQGTTGTRVILFNHDGEIHSMAIVRSGSFIRIQVGSSTIRMISGRPFSLVRKKHAGRGRLIQRDRCYRYNKSAGEYHPLGKGYGTANL